MNARPLANASTSPTTTFSLEVWGATDVGRQAAHNEDSIWPEESKATLPDGSYLLLVADGVGGTQAGGAASRISVEEIVGYCFTAPITDPVQILYRAIQAANTAVYHYALDESGFSQAASTVVVALVKGNQLHLANVGDSRAYLIKNGVAEQLTRDHTLTQQKIDLGQLDPRLAPYDEERNIITRSIGSAATVQIDLDSTGPRLLQAGDTLLLCSDGLTDMLTETDIARLAGSSPPRRAARRLIAKANQRGGSDNISVVIGRVPGPTTLPGTDWGHLLLGFGGMLLLLACVLLLGGLFLNRFPESPTPATPTLLVSVVVATLPTAVDRATPPTATPIPEFSPGPTFSPQPTLFATSTPYPTPTPSPTIGIVSSLPTPTVVVIPTPDPAQQPSPAPALTDPPDGSVVPGGSQTEFKWKWAGSLDENQGFEMRIWHEEDAALNSEHHQALDASRLMSELDHQNDGIYKIAFSIDEAYSVQENGPGFYYWTVVVVNMEADRAISLEAAPRKLEYK